MSPEDIAVQQNTFIDVLVGNCRVIISPDAVLINDDGVKVINWPVQDMQACLQRVWSAMFPPGNMTPPDFRW
jgi:hypothetical protein